MPKTASTKARHNTLATMSDRAAPAAILKPSSRDCSATTKREPRTTQVRTEGVRPRQSRKPRRPGSAVETPASHEQHRADHNQTQERPCRTALRRFEQWS